MLRLVLPWFAMHGALCGLVSAEGVRLGHVEKDLSAGSGCALQLPSDFARKTGLFIFTSDGEGRASIDLDGVDEELTLQAVQPDRTAGVPADGSSYRYSGRDGIAVEVDYRVKRACLHTDASCVMTYYDATLSVQQRKRSKTVAAKGACGRSQ